MARVGLIGVGDMGSGMAANILKNGHDLVLCDLRPEQLAPFVARGARAAETPAQVGDHADFVFVMVMNGAQIAAILKGGLLDSLKPGSTFICTSTIPRSELIEVAQWLEDKGINVVDAPVSGGAPGATAGTLTMMVAAQREVFDHTKEVLQSVGEHIYHVGEEIGTGQTVKACLAVLTGVTYAGIFETLALGVKAGVKPETLCEVIDTSVVGSFLFRDTAQNILERKFVGQSRIGTMYKDLGIAKALGRECGVPLFTLSSAAEWFQAGISVNPDESNWAIIKIFEDMLGIEVKGKTGDGRREAGDGRRKTGDVRRKT